MKETLRVVSVKFTLKTHLPHSCGLRSCLVFVEGFFFISFSSSVDVKGVTFDCFFCESHEGPRLITSLSFDKTRNLRQALISSSKCTSFFSVENACGTRFSAFLK